MFSEVLLVYFTLLVSISLEDWCPVNVSGTTFFSVK